MRVIAGTARSLPLKTPAGMETRPTTDRIKETLFNVLQGDLCDCVFVDLFAGSGGVGIEALSRGARKAYFVDNAPSSINCVMENLLFTKMADKAVVLKQDVLAALHQIYEKEVDIVFMDPPYDMELEKQVLFQLKSMKYITSNTLVVVEASIDTDFDYLDSYGFEMVKEKVYKTNKHIFLKLREG